MVASVLAILLAFKLLNDHVKKEKNKRVGEGESGGSSLGNADRSKIIPVNNESEESGGDEGEKSQTLKTWT